MSIDRTEEEQVEAVKEWFKKNGSALIFGLAIGLASIGGYRFWQDYSNSQLQNASLAYGVYENKLMANELTEVFSLGEKLIKEYPDTPYAALAALGMAKVNVENLSLESAEVHLNWVISNCDQAGLVHIARLRLARILAAQEKYDAALAHVNQSQSSFDTLYSEVQGDIMLAKGDISRAREFYQVAVDTADSSDRRTQLILLKMNDISANSN
ncbi:MAG: tetratricopeptide repeat protein [Gammaproteobacteria bacterium]|nr:tetratricopeptide repeat protein [Gammaproteobacteria bacterium]